MFNIDLAIKFGSSEIIIYRKGVGIIAKEPAFLAVQENGKKFKVKAIGKKAEKLYLSKTASVTIYQPIKNSEIVNEEMATILISEILKDIITDKFLLTNLTALVAVPCALNEKQLRLLKKVLNMSGINKITFVQNSVCVRSTLDIDSHAHVMVVDIGKYLTDISVLNEYSLDFGRLYFIGGQDMDKCVKTFVSDNYGLEISNLTSEMVKNEVASLYDRDQYKTEYAGLDENQKFVKNEISANEVRLSIINVYDTIFKLIEDVLTRLDKDIRADVYNNGIVFVGGASSIPGLYEYAKKKLDLPIFIPDEPMDTVIMGAGKLLTSGKEFIKIDI